MTRGMTLRRLALGALATTMLAAPAWAGPGHDHDHDTAAPAGNGPQRRADGHVFLPKPSQRQLAIRTQRVVAAELARSVELMGRVVMDPNAGGLVQPTLAGRIEPGPGGLPLLGTAVRRGEVLAYVRPSESAPAELALNLELAERRLARLAQLEGSVPQKEIEAARIELQSLRERAQPGGGRFAAREALTAPVSGVIAASNALAGKVVDAREIVFEIIDPSRVRIEAVAFDAATAADIAGGVAMVGAHSVPLVFEGGARLLREGALPLAFRPKPAKGDVLPPLAINQPVRVVAQTRSSIKGIAVPAGAVVKSPSNQDIVWVHETAEVFAPAPVRFVPLDGTRVAVIDGLSEGMRVVVQGAPLLNQVR